MKRAAIALLPGGLVIWLAFNGGGFFAGEPALAAALMCGALLLRVTLARDPTEGLGPALLVAAAALALLAGWTLASALWSDAPARALIEFDRTLLYLLVLIYAGSFLRNGSQVRWAVRGIAAASVTVCGIALVTRMLPEVWPTAPNIHPGRLSYPLTYWNALGLLAGLGMVLCFALTSDEREARTGRVLAAAALPVVACTLILTSSRGAFFSTAIALGAYALIARPRGFPGGFFATAPITVLAMREAYHANALKSSNPLSEGALAEGHELAVFVVVCVVAATFLRILFLALDGRLSRIEISPRLRRRIALPAAMLGLVAAIGAGVTFDIGARIGDRYEEFTADATPGNSGGRLLSTRNNGRLRTWGVGVDAFERNPLHGSGAGTFQLEWTRERERDLDQVDGHSLYVEVLGELGVVGLGLLVAALLAVFVAVALRLREGDRALYGGILAAGLAWALAAGVDWHWESAAVTLPFFALGGAALASSRPRVAVPGLAARVAIGAGLLVLAVSPARVAVSQARLNDAVRAFRAGDCPAAIDRALGATEALGARPEPYEVLGWCDARLGHTRLGERMMRAAIERDPNNWELHYGLALVRGVGRRDPLPAARRALRLNPLGALPTAAVRRFRTRDPRKWEAGARISRLPLR